jgi:hypothetical protein
MQKIAILCSAWREWKNIGDYSAAGASGQCVLGK